MLHRTQLIHFKYTKIIYLLISRNYTMIPLAFKCYKINLNADMAFTVLILEFWV